LHSNPFHSHLLILLFDVLCIESLIIWIHIFKLNSLTKFIQDLLGDDWYSSNRSTIHWWPSKWSSSLWGVFLWL
jgi:hypothetical protein